MPQSQARRRLQSCAPRKCNTSCTKCTKYISFVDSPIIKMLLDCISTLQKINLYLSDFQSEYSRHCGMPCYAMRCMINDRFTSRPIKKVHFYFNGIFTPFAMAKLFCSYVRSRSAVVSLKANMNTVWRLTRSTPFMISRMHPCLRLINRFDCQHQIVDTFHTGF